MEDRLRASFSKYLPDGNIPSYTKEFFNSISATQIPSARPLACLTACLAVNQHSLSVYELVRCYNKCWKSLPENAKSGLGSEYDGLIETTSRLVKSSYSSMLDLLPQNSDAPAIVDGLGQRSLSHRSLFKFVRNFKLSGAGIGDEKSVVAVALPNGALLGLLSVAVAAHYILAPINVTSGAEQFRMDLLQTGSKIVLVLQADIHRLGLDGDWPAEHGIGIFIVMPAQDMTFTVSAVKQPMLTSFSTPTKPNGP